MFCERCKESEATIHLTEIIKDVKSEVHLCENCARDIGLNSKLSNFTLSIPEMLSFLDIDELDDSVDGTLCRTCGRAFIDYNKEGKLGCPDCYNYLGESLESIIVGYHGERLHIGKHPSNCSAVAYRARHDEPETVRDVSIDNLKDDLEKAVFEERYEEAAIIRDRIRDIEGSKE